MKGLEWIIAMLVMTVLPLQAQVTSEAGELLQLAREKLKNTDYYGAVRDFNRVLKLHPELPEALAGRAVARNYLGDSDAALADANAAVEQAPASADILYNRAEILFSQKKYPLAEKDYAGVLKMKPDFSDAFRGRILSMNLSGKDKEAMELVESNIKSQPDNSMNYYLRGLLFSLRQKYSKALEDYDKAINLGPGSNAANCYMNRGIAYLGVEEFTQAKEDLDQAIGLDTTNLVAYLSRGRASYNLRNYEDAVQDFTRVINANPANDAAYYNLGMAYFRLENKSAACQNFHKACSMGNTSACRMVVMECSENNQ